MKTFVFYAGLLYGEYSYNRFDPFNQLRELPDGAYIYFPNDVWAEPIRWYRSDFTPVLLDDVPKELLTLVLLLT